MKRLFALLLALLLLFPAALAENKVFTVYHAPSNSKAPFMEVPVLDAPPFEEGADLLQVDFINIKIGDAILLRCGGESMMIDGGTNDKLPWLELFFQSQGITGFTYYMNTHSHDDHINAAIRLVYKGYPATAFLTKYSRETRVDEITKLFAALDSKGIPHRQIVPGEKIMLGGAEVTFLQNTRAGGATGINARSMLVHVRFGSSTLLLPADVTGASLGEVMEDWPEYMDVDLMKSPHHGINRLRQEFFDATSPEAIVITANMAHGANLAKQLNSSKIPHYFVSMGTVSAVTDGQTWYVKQTPVE